jgi:hypothetical protein
MALPEKNASISHYSYVGSRGTSVMAVHNVALADVLGKQKPQPLSRRMFMVGASTANFRDLRADKSIALRMFTSCDFELLHQRMYDRNILLSPTLEPISH